jgi:hypothetical protein
MFLEDSVNAFKSQPGKVLQLKSATQRCLIQHESLVYNSMALLP